MSIRRLAQMLATISVLCSAFVGTARAQGNNCDCQEIIGACSASISVIPTESTMGSYGADLNIQSTTPNCAKVDYYVDGMPYFTILSQGNRGSDRVFGPKPITRANVSDISCKVCRPVGRPAPSRDKDAGAEVRDTNEAPVDLTGSWRSTQTCSYGSGASTMTLSQSDMDRAAISGRLSNATIDSGTIQGKRITIEASHWLGNKVHMEGTVLSATRMAGTYTQSSRAGVCQWDAIKQ
ncbi:hypothetical protein [Cupriavidus sp. D39]|uniref:hypothetical protein n=1 Tax=Cupriavidus sp. D39 TaxID=2997877 RepID=UPI0022701672|nr:hypothetical protein [Cupriavidus sp. D39]MCY0853362.1 hypothetical protein [Cupriavidus sp. D39]